MKLSLRETARQLQVDPATIKKYAKKLGLKTYWQERSPVTDEKIDNTENTVNENDKQKLYRNVWLDLMRQYPNKSKT